MLLLSHGSSRERGVEGRYNVTLCSYCLMAGEQRKEWRGSYNVTLCSYSVMALRVAMLHGKFIIVGLGVGLKNVGIRVQHHCGVG